MSRTGTINYGVHRAQTIATFSWSRSAAKPVLPLYISSTPLRRTSHCGSTVWLSVRFLTAQKLENPRTAKQSGLSLKYMSIEPSISGRAIFASHWFFWHYFKRRVVWRFFQVSLCTRRSVYASQSWELHQSQAQILQGVPWFMVHDFTQISGCALTRIDFQVRQHGNVAHSGLSVTFSWWCRLVCTVVIKLLMDDDHCHHCHHRFLVTVVTCCHMLSPLWECEHRNCTEVRQWKQRKPWPRNKVCNWCNASSKMSRCRPCGAEERDRAERSQHIVTQKHDIVTYCHTMSTMLRHPLSC